MSSNVDEFENAFQSCVAALTSPTSNFTHDAEEVKTSADQTVQRFLDSAKSMECFFLQKRLYLSVHRPEQMIKEEIDEIRTEIQRKDAVISRFHEKLVQWKAMLADQHQVDGGMSAGPSPHPLAPAPHPMIQQHLQLGHPSPAVPQMGIRPPHPGQQMMSQMPGVPGHSGPPHSMPQQQQQQQGQHPGPQMMHMQQQQQASPHGHVGPQHVMQPGMRMQQQAGQGQQHLMNPATRGPMMQPNYGPNVGQAPHHFAQGQMGMQQQGMPQQQQPPMPQVMQQQAQQHPQQQPHQAQQSPLAFLERTTSNIGMPDGRR